MQKSRVIQSIKAPDSRPLNRQRTVLLFLFLALTINYVDRGIFNVLAEPLKRELKLSDLQIGVLGGLSFALLHVTMGIPIARAADRYDRVAIISWAMALWSGLTICCGGVWHFTQLVALRIGIGVGEAGTAAPANSILSDYVPPEQRTTALAWVNLGVPLGSMIGIVGGGLVAHFWSWRAAFLVAGLPGLIIAVATRRLLVEPPRGRLDSKSMAIDNMPGLWPVVRSLLKIRTFLFFSLGGAMANLGNQGVAQFNASFFVRRFELNIAEVGLIIGISNAAAAIAGILFGGIAADRVGNRDPRWYGWVSAAGMFAAAPLTVLGFEQPSWERVLMVQIVTSICSVLYIAPVLGVNQNLAPPKMRATVVALFNVISSGVGYGVGPITIGLLGDRAARRAFAAAGHGVFAISCPGGVAAPTQAPAVQAACLSASAAGIQEALTLAAITYVLAAAAFFAGAYSITSDLMKVRSNDTDIRAQFEDE